MCCPCVVCQNKKDYSSSKILHTHLLRSGFMPALSNLSGQTNKGYNACTHCLDETEGTYLNKCKNVVYLGHRRFLPTRHPVRKKGKHFKGEANHRKKPVHRTGDDVFGMVKDLEVIFGNGHG